MAEEEPDLKELVRLSPQGKQQLTDLEKQIRLAQKGINVMKEMDMDTTMLQTELDRYKKTREILLREFAD